MEVRENFVKYKRHHQVGTTFDLTRQIVRQKGASHVNIPYLCRDSLNSVPCFWRDFQKVQALQNFSIFSNNLFLPYIYISEAELAISEIVIHFVDKPTEVIKKSLGCDVYFDNRGCDCCQSKKKYGL